MKSRYLTAITDKPWWLAGGIPRDACVAAYQSVGASDYAASKINLANPGTYNATDGAAYPTWAVDTGWVLNGSTQYLNSGVIVAPTSTWSAIVRFSGGAITGYRALLGARTWPAAHDFFIDVSNNGASVASRNATTATSPNVIAPIMTEGVYCLAGTVPYRNGVADGAGHAVGAGESVLPTLYIGGIHQGTSLSSTFSGNIQAVAIYSITLTLTQVAMLKTAMIAL